MILFYQGLSLSRFIPQGGALTNSLRLAMWIFIFFAAVGIIIFMVRTVVKYRYRGEINLRRQVDWDTGIPQSKILEGRAAYIRKKGRQIFRIRYGLLPWQLVDVHKLPNPKYMVGNKAYFLQLNVGELVQAKKEIKWGVGEVEIIPVDNTTKDAAKQDLGTYNQILNASRITPQMIAIASMAMVLVTGIIVLYFVSKG